MLLPSTFKPTEFHQLVGPAAKAAAFAERTIEKARTVEGYKVREMFYGPPGVGKTQLAQLMATRLAGHPMAVREYSGVKFTIDIVQELIEAARFSSLFGDIQVTIVNELDRTPSSARDLLLQYLDEMPASRAFIATSNLQIDELPERLHSRLAATRIDAPSTEDIIDFILAQWPDTRRTDAASLAVASGGNIRALLLDLEKLQDTYAIAA